MNAPFASRAELTSRKGATRRSSCCTRALKAGDRVAVAGGTGGVGQLCAQRLMDKGFKVRIFTRSEDKAEEIFGTAGDAIEFIEVDLKDPDDIKKKHVFKDCAACVIATGTTAFPTNKWSGGNGPRQTDFLNTQNLVSAMPKTLQHVSLCTSAGVERADSFPFSFLNSFGVLTYKKAGEELVKGSGIPYTIIRPGRLTEGPYTGRGLNDMILRQATGRLKGVHLSKQDDLTGEAARSMVAEFLAQTLLIDALRNRVLAMESTNEGEGPGTDTDKWEALIPA